MVLDTVNSNLSRYGKIRIYAYTVNSYTFLGVYNRGLKYNV